MFVAAPDGTRRFDPIRKSRAVEKELKAEKDKKRQQALKNDLIKISKEA